MDDIKAKNFANQMGKWNQYQQIPIIIVLMIPFLVLLMNAVSMDYINYQQEGVYILGMVSTVLFIAIFFTITFCNLYIYVDGKDGKMQQSILDTVGYQPFTLDVYFQIIKKKYMTMEIILLSISLIIFVFGAFWKVEEKETELTMIYDIQQVEGGMVLPYMLLVTLAGIVILSVTCKISFYLYEQKIRKQLKNQKRKNAKSEKGRVIRYGQCRIC